LLTIAIVKSALRLLRLLRKFYYFGTVNYESVSFSKIFWSYFLNWLGYKIPAVGKFVSPPPLILVKDGRLIKQNMEQELLTKEELMSQLRQQGVESLDKVKKAYMEADGRISIITNR